MSRARLAQVAGALLLVTAFLVPCLPLIDVAGTSMPYQDPTPEMVAEQAADIAAAEHRLAVTAVIGGALAFCGLVVLVWSRKLKR